MGLIFLAAASLFLGFGLPGEAWGWTRGLITRDEVVFSDAGAGALGLLFQNSNATTKSSSPKSTRPTRSSSSLRCNLVSRRVTASSLCESSSASVCSCCASRPWSRKASSRSRRRDSASWWFCFSRMRLCASLLCGQDQAGSARSIPKKALRRASIARVPGLIQDRQGTLLRQPPSPRRLHVLFGLLPCDPCHGVFGSPSSLAKASTNSASRCCSDFSSGWSRS